MEDAEVGVIGHYRYCTVSAVPCQGKAKILCIYNIGAKYRTGIVFDHTMESHVGISNGLRVTIFLSSRATGGYYPYVM